MQSRRLWVAVLGMANGSRVTPLPQHSQNVRASLPANGGVVGAGPRRHSKYTSQIQPDQSRIPLLVTARKPSVQPYVIHPLARQSPEWKATSAPDGNFHREWLGVIRDTPAGRAARPVWKVVLAMA